MADLILTVASTDAQSTDQYSLSETDRQAILAQSDLAETDRKIQIQHDSFCARNNGDPFGQEPPKIAA